MGGLISLLRDIKTVYKDLKVTLKLSARIVVKVHGIVDDVEQTLQELKSAVRRLSAKLNPNRDGKGDVGLDTLVENVESKANLLKTSLIEASSQVFNEDLLRSTQEKWDKVTEYSKQSKEAFANIMACSSWDSVKEDTNVLHHVNLGDDIKLPIPVLDDKEEEKKYTEAHLDSNRALAPVSGRRTILLNNKIDEEFEDFEILPFDIVDTSWKCDIGCFNIDCVDFQHLPRSRLITRRGGETLRKKKTKKRIKHGGKLPKSGKKVPSSKFSEHLPTNVTKYHQNKQKQSKENVALELIFLIAVLVEGAAMSNSKLLPHRQNSWKDSSYTFSTAEIIELDD